MKKFLFDVCVFLDSTRQDKCNNFLNEVIELIKLFFNSSLSIVIIILIFIILIKIIKSNDNKREYNYFFIISLFLLFCAILFNFKTNVPWVDDWEWIENLQLKKLTTIEWLFQPTNIHNILFIKMLFLFVDRYFNLNFEIFSYLSIIIIFFISLILLLKEKKITNPYIILIVFLIFSGKQFANISQASNIAWTICFLYIILFAYFIKRSLPLTSIIIFIAPSTFGLGYVIPIYNIFFIYFTKLSNNIKIFYFLLSIFSILFASTAPQIFFENNLASDSSINYLKNIFNIRIYFTFFAVLANIYLPWINGASYLGFFIGFSQILLTFFIISKTYFEIGRSSIINFFGENIQFFPAVTL